MRHYPPVTEQAGRQIEVARMFDAVAPRYDLINRIVSLGQDRKWRRVAVRKLGNLDGADVLDVATGTGDVALSLLKRNPARIVGVDIAAAMLERARQKASACGGGERLEYVTACAEDLPFDDATFDAAVVAFGIRNFENMDLGLLEIHRTLRPSAPLVVLEFSRPESAIVRWGSAVYSRNVLPIIGGLLSRAQGAYQYLPDSIRAFPSGQEFLQHMHRAGFRRLQATPLTLGVVTVYRGYRSDAG
ncbi:MAG: bifunctional demethylmenaquinone methyltransferase/2-methoxy-6-polyprenyl-1,4-benzoquinol methylase UbiE [Bacteroidota bacterium]|nr:bifunctional demethylmenaquinone methyltransferase/2-methoxy-6-polyprenyl-1,4-benzoquinol methylase UbiE [Bacteroidota bacterium]